MEKIKVSDVARMLGTAEQAVRIGLQRGLFDFGVAFKKDEKNKKYTYLFSAEKLKAWVGEDVYNDVLGKCKERKYERNIQ